MNRDDGGTKVSNKEEKVKRKRAVVVVDTKCLQGSLTISL